jgi:hypothetical protein
MPLGDSARIRQHHRDTRHLGALMRAAVVAPAIPLTIQKRPVPPSDVKISAPVLSAP